MTSKHLYLSHHPADDEAVQFIKAQLERQGVALCLDEPAPDRADAGAQSWPDRLQAAQAVTVLIGPFGLSRPQKQVIGLALERQAQLERGGGPYPVVPVLLPGADLAPAFLFGDHWLDCRHDLLDERAIAALTQAAHAVARKRPPAVIVDHCPYRGLKPFREEDAAFFFGRNAAVDRLVAALEEQQLVALVGPAGSGKTSVVQAGLLPRLRRRNSPASWWEVLCLRPGERPFDRLALSLLEVMGPGQSEDTRSTLSRQLAAGKMALADRVEEILAGQKGQTRLLLVIDQFEQLLLTPAAEQAAFVELLSSALTHPFFSLLILLGADAYGQAAASNDRLGRWLEGCVINLGRPKAEELREACLKPARLVTAAIEPELVETLIGQAGRLPLVEFCLSQLWRQRRDGLLNRAAFERMGGLTGAPADRAEEIFKSLPPGRQQRVGPILKALVQIDDRGQSRCRRAVPRAEVAPSPDKVHHFETQKTISALVEGELLAVENDPFTGEEKIKLSHPIWLEHWPRLSAWLDKEHEFLLWRRRLGRTVAGWEQARRPRRLLLDHAPLTEAEEWLKARPQALLPAERAYIQRGAARRRRRQWSRWVIGLAAAAVVLWVIVLVTFQQTRALRSIANERDIALTAQAQTELALQEAGLKQATAEAERRSADQQRQQALARQLAVQAEVIVDRHSGRLASGMLMAIESLRRDPSLETEQILRRGLIRLPRPAARLVHEDEVWAAIFSPDGQWLATRSGRTVHIWSVATGAEAARLEHEGYLNQMAFSSDGRWLATASLNQTAQLWEVDTGREVARLRHDDRVWGVAFSPDGRWLATRSERTAYVWQLTPGRAGPFTPDLPEQLPGDPEMPLPLRRWEKKRPPPPETTITLIGRGMVRMPHQKIVVALAFSPDGRWLATTSVDQTARLWEVATGQEKARLKHDGVVGAVAFSPDGRLLVTGSADHTARIWPLSVEPADGPAVESPEVRLAHPEGVNSVTFSPDGRWLATAGSDNVVRVWILASETAGESGAVAAQEVAQLPHRDRVWAVKFDSEGRRIATASADGTARVWLASTGRELAQMTHTGRVMDAAFSPDGRRLATASADHTAQLWEATIGYEVAQMEHDDWVLGVDFGADGRSLATRSGHTVQIWAAGSGAELARLEHDTYVNAVAFSPDKRWLATGSYRSVRVWEADSGRERAQMVHGGLVRTLAFSPDGRHLATAGVDKIARVWDTDSGREVAQMRHDNWVSAVAFSPDGRWLATASDDRTARVWEVSSGQELARLEHDKVVNAVTFSPDGRWVATAGGDGTARIWLATTVKEAARLPHEGAVRGVAFSPDGRWLATRSRENVFIWNVDAGQMAARMKHNGIVEGLAFSPDSRYLATASGDRTARVWEIDTGQEVARLVHEYWVNAVAFSPDGRWLATASADRTARVWLLRREELLAEVCLRLPHNLSPQQWQQHLGDEPYRATCPDLPIPDAAYATSSGLD